MSSDDLIREAGNPTTTAGRLAELAAADRTTWVAIAGHPHAYDGLLAWLGERGDAQVDAALEARAQAAAAQAALPPIPPPAPPAPPEPANQPEPTVQLPAQPAPAPAPEAPDATTDGSGGGSGRPLAVVIAMVVIVLALIGGAAYGATQVFGGDDKPGGVTASDTKETTAPSDDAAPTTPAPTTPSADTGSGASSGFCTTMKDIQERSMDALGDLSGDPGSDSAKSLADELLDKYADAEQSAPAELRADIAKMSAPFELLKNPTAEGASKLSESMSGYAEAAQRVGVYYAQNCL